MTVRMYGDERFMRLSPLPPSGQSLWLYLLTGPHTGPIPGVFQSGRAALAETLGWDAKAFEEAFAEVLREGLVEFDGKTRIFFIPNAIRHNAPPNPNVVKSWRAHWFLLPECEMRDRIFGHIFAALSEVSDAFGKAFAEACGKSFEKASPKDMAKQEAGSRKQEQEEERTSLTRSKTVKAPTSCPQDQIVGLYHAKLPELPRVKLVTKDRVRALQNRWAWVLSSTKSDGSRRASTPDEALAWFGEYFGRASANDFLMGRTARGAGHENWRCDLDYLLTDRGLKQVIEKTEVPA